MKKLSPATLVVIFISAVMAIANSTAFFVSLFREPPGTVYLGTVHYWEDYFLYLNHFFQGAHGAWLTFNRYTPEATPPSIIYWNNVLLGKLFGMFGVNPVLSYNVSILILSFTSLVLLYSVTKLVLTKHPYLTLPAFIMAATATSLINRVRSSDGPMIFWPFQIWRTPHFAFDRLGGAPHQLFITILSYLLLILYYGQPRSQTGKKYRYAYLTLVAVMFTTMQPVQAAVFAGVILAGELLVFFLRRKRPDVTALGLTVIATAVTFLYMNRIYSLPPHIQARVWEASQHSYTTWPFLFLSIGPIVAFALLGFAVSIKRLQSAEIAGALLIIGGYVFFMSRIPQGLGVSNLRILFPATYAFWGIFAAYGLEFIAGKVKSLTKLKVSPSRCLPLFLFILITLPTLAWEVTQKIPKKTDVGDPMVYLPEDVYSGFTKLSQTGSFNDIVVAGPLAHMDTLVPALSGHTVYSGHMLATVDNTGKQSVAGRFFRGELDAVTARTWLDKEHVRYAFFTVYDGNRIVFEKHYPFLKGIFDNGSTAIYEVKQ